jgi:transposase
MWTPATRQQHSRTIARYQTDLTDAEWRVIAPHLPKPCATGRPREWPMREIINGIFYVMRAGRPWRLLPNDLPPWGTIYRWFAAWRDDGRFERINHALVMADRERVGRDASPSAAIIDQPERQDNRGRRPARLRCGQEDQRTQAPCARRHRRARPRDRSASGEHPGSRRRGSASQSLAPIIPLHRAGLRRQRVCRREVAKATLIVVEIVRKNPDQVGFAVNPRRWVVERFFAWIGRNRRLAKDFEATIDSARAFLYASSVMLLVRRMARPS